MGTTKQYPEEIRAEAVRRYMAVESSPKIAADLGCTAKAVLSWVNKSFETPERSVKQMDENKKPAAAATATDEKPNVSKYSSYLYDSTEKEFCQVMLAGILELADDIIADESTDAEVAGYAGKIGGLAMALEKALLSGEHEC